MLLPRKWQVFVCTSRIEIKVGVTCSMPLKSGNDDLIPLQNLLLAYLSVRKLTKIHPTHQCRTQMSQMCWRLNRSSGCSDTRWKTESWLMCSTTGNVFCKWSSQAVQSPITPASFYRQKFKLHFFLIDKYQDGVDETFNLMNMRTFTVGIIPRVYQFKRGG